MAYQRIVSASLSDQVDISKVIVDGISLQKRYVLFSASAVPALVYQGEMVPVEIAVAAFSVEEGVVETFWSLIDPSALPTASTYDAKLLASETGLPTTNEHYKPMHKDFAGISKRVASMFQRYCCNSGDVPIVFMMEKEIETGYGCFKWLQNHCEDANFKKVFSETEIYDLPFLFLELGKYVRQGINAEYNSPMIQFNLPVLAGNLLNRFTKYNFCRDISCTFHADVSRDYMRSCALNIVIRRIVCILEELAVAAKVELKDGHFIRRKDDQPNIVEITFRGLDG